VSKRTAVKIPSDLKKCNILNLTRLLDHPITGGEIYNSKLDQYLKTRFSKVENISWPNRPFKNPLGFLIKSISQNVSNAFLLRIIKDISGDVIILEEGSQSEDLFLFNLFIRGIRNIMGKKIRIVSVIHHTYAPLMDNKIKKKLLYLEESVYANTLDGIIVPSEFTRKTVEGMLKRDIDISIAHPGLNISGVNEKKIFKDDDKLNLLFVGYTIKRKGVDSLVKGFDILIKKYGQENLILHIAGDPNRDKDFSKSILEYCENMGISDRVVVHGRVSEIDLKNLYRNADIFVFPSLWEGFGIVLAEAMSYSLPIVTTDVGAIPYLIKDGHNGFLVPPEDPERLAKSIAKLVASPELRTTFGESNRIAACEFSWKRSFFKIETFLEEIISR
jgi:glycosyltransferase involved in cell wall biosynthesis